MNEKDRVPWSDEQALMALEMMRKQAKFKDWGGETTREWLPLAENLYADLARLRQQVVELESCKSATVTAVSILCERKWGGARGAIIEDYPELSRIIDDAFDKTDAHITELEQRNAELEDQYADAIESNTQAAIRSAELVKALECIPDYLYNDYHGVKWFDNLMAALSNAKERQK